MEEIPIFLQPDALRGIARPLSVCVCVCGGLRQIRYLMRNGPFLVLY